MTDAWMPGAERLSAAADGGRLKGGAPRAVWLVLHADPMTVSARAATEHLIELGRPPHLVWNPLSGEVTQLIPAVRAGRALGWADGPRWGPRTAGPGWGTGPGSGTAGLGHRMRLGGGPGSRGIRGATPGLGRGQRLERAGRLDAQPGLGAAAGQDQTGRRIPAGPMGRTGRRASGGRTAAASGSWPTRRPGPAAEPSAPPARDGLAGVNNEGRVCVQIGVIGHAWAPFTEGPVVRVREIVSWLDSWHVARGWPAGRPAPFRGSGAARASAPPQLGPGRPFRRLPGPRLQRGRPGGHRHRDS